MSASDLELGLPPSPAALEPMGWPKLKNLVNGYPKLGEHMGLFPELAIFRRFGGLNAQILLYLQAEIIELEMLLHRSESESKSSVVGERSQFSVNWFWLGHGETDEERKEWNLVQKIKEKLKDYNQLLIQQATITSMAEPSAYDLDDLQRTLVSTDLAPPLCGDDAKVWGTVRKPYERAPDLITLQPRHNEDRFSKWVTEKWMKKFFNWKWDCFRKPNPVHGMITYKDRTLLRLTEWISSIVASLLLITSILVLYYVKATPARLGIIAAFNVVLAVCLTGLTTAKRAEVFAITAAFAAVQVVFVGSTSSPN